MKIMPLKDVEFDLIELADDGNIGRLTPHCKKHRAMLKLTENGIFNFGLIPYSLMDWN